MASRLLVWRNAAGAEAFGAAKHRGSGEAEFACFSGTIASCSGLVVESVGFADEDAKQNAVSH